MAYKSKYYDPVKAHEYYMKHRKLKGRKKKTSTADLSEAGKVAASEVKEQLQAELKAALKKVKRGNTAERKRLRDLYNQKYEAELEEIRKDSAMVKAPKQKKQAKQATSKGSSSKGSSSKGGGTSKRSGAKKTQVTQPIKTEKERLSDAITMLKEKIDGMSKEQRAQAKALLMSLVNQYKKKG